MKLLTVLLTVTAVAATPLASTIKSEQLQKRQAPQDCPNAADNSYEAIMLYNFNVHRDNHSAPHFVWNETLAAAAKATTEKDTLAHDNDGTGWGQNLYAWSSSDASDYHLGGWGAIDWWYNGEFSNYDAYGDASLLDLEDNPDIWQPPPAAPGEIFGHFTQTVWVDSTSVGCATTEHDGDDGTPGTWTACDFYPPGNWVTSDSSWVDNVLPPQGADVVVTVCPPDAS